MKYRSTDETAVRFDKKGRKEVWEMELLCKIAGSVFVITGSGYLAMSMNHTMEQRAIDLRRLYSILLQLKSEMQYMGNTLPECFLRLKEGCCEPFCAWLDKLVVRLEEEDGNIFRTVWLESLDSLYSESVFEEKDVEPLRELADKLGNEDITAQLKAIDYVLIHIEQNRKELEGEIKERKKVVTSLSIFAGMLVLILLL